jgi:hypothetical protein
MVFQFHCLLLLLCLNQNFPKIFKIDIITMFLQPWLMLTCNIYSETCLIRTSLEPAFVFEIHVQHAHLPSAEGFLPPK